MIQLVQKLHDLFDKLKNRILKIQKKMENEDRTNGDRTKGDRANGDR